MVAEPQLVDYIKKAKDMGQSDDQTRTLLAQNGWTVAEINDAFAEIPQPIAQPQPVVIQPQVQPQPQPQPVIQPQIQTQPQPQVQYKPQPLEQKKSHLTLKLLIVLVILIIIALAGYFALGQPNLIKLLPSPTLKPTQSSSPTPVADVFSMPSFAQYNLTTTDYKPSLPTYQISLSELTNRENLSVAQQTALTTDNFFIAKNNDKNFSGGDDWTNLYGQSEVPIFITTDFLAHTYSKLINSEFPNIEENNLYPSLVSLSKSLLSSSETAYGTETVQEQKDSYDRLSAYFLVASAILDNTATDTKTDILAKADSLAQSNKVSDNAKNIAEQKIGLIFDTYVPTGHYTENTILRDYFRVMTFYGSTNFLSSDPELARDATNIKQLLTSDELKQWESIYQTVAFFAGQGNQINPETATGFTFMPPRFTQDAYIFSALTQNGLPSMPTALMFSTLAGSKVSANQLGVWTTNNNSNSAKALTDQMAILQAGLNNATQQQWTQNIYWSWIYTIKSLFTDNIADKTGYPMFVKSSNWDTKNLQTFLGSWTELKHDNVVSSSQNPIAGASPATTAHGYVEPNIEFFDRLIALSNFVNDGLNQNGLLSPDFQAKNKAFIDTLTFYRTIAVAELQNQNISDSDFEKLQSTTGQLDKILQPSSKSALISNIFTDTTANKNLYEADGIPNYIYVAVKDANGTRLTKGLVYSYYEFTSSSSKNYTDPLWQSWEYSTIPQKLQMPWWSAALLK